MTVNGGLTGRVALVTGGGRGIGRAISLGLAADGADVAVNYARDEESALKTVTEIEQIGRRARAYQASVDSWEECQHLVSEVLSDFGQIGIFVNNAGIASRGKTVVHTDPEEFERVMRIHAFAPHYLAKLILPDMREQERGDIVVISSVATLQNAAGGAPYNMGKAALDALAITLANEERKNNIHVNIVAPGLVDTEMGRRLVKGAAGVDDITKLNPMMPFGRVCQPEDVANVVRFLVSERAGYLTGERLNVHGGGGGFG